MEVSITQETKQPDMGRTHYSVQLVYDQKATPSRQEIKQAFAKRQKTNEELTIVRPIKTAFGATGADVEVVVYDNAEQMTNFELTHIRKRNEAPKAEEGS